MLDSLGVATCLVDASQPGLPLTYVNPAFEELTGWSRADAVGRNCRFLQGPDTDPRAVAELRDAIAHGEACRVTLVNYRRDGEPFWNQLTITPVMGPRDRVIAFTGALVEVTAHVVEGELRYRSLVEQIDAITYTADWSPDSRLRYVSPQIEGLLGFAPADWVADQELWARRLHPEDRDRVLEEERSAHLAGEGLDTEYRMLAADGSTRWFWERATIVRDARCSPRA